MGRAWKKTCPVLILCVIAIFSVFYFKNKKNVEQQWGSNPAPKSHPLNREAGVSFFKTDNPYKDEREWKTFAEALEKYKTFHREKLKQFKSSSDGGGVRMLTWACSQSECSGLGDQLFRIQYFLLLAIMSDRVFTIYWDEKLKASADYLLPNEIEWNYFNKSKGMCSDKGQCSHTVYRSTSIFGLGWTNDEFSNFGKTLFSSEPLITVTGKVVAKIMYIGNRTIYDPGELITKGMERLGIEQILSEKANDTIYWYQRSLWFDLLHRFGVNRFMEIPKVGAGFGVINNLWIYVSHYVLTYLFQFSMNFVGRVAEYKKSLGLHGKDYLSLHLRTGFTGASYQEKWTSRYLHGESKLFDTEKEWDCFIKHSIELRNEILGSMAPIYLSTDSNLVKKRVKSRYSNHHFVFGNLALMHSGMHQNYAAGNVELDGHLAMWLDFFMLADGKVIVHPSSSFSVNAAFVRPIPHVNHSWVFYEHHLKCIASYRAGFPPSCISC